MERVWLILAQIKVMGENPPCLEIGSEAVIQCFIPTRAVEAALLECDKLLKREGMFRTDVLRCISFRADEEEIDDFVKGNILEARRSGKPLIGPCFTWRE
jgi:hypothetical protein